MEILTFNQTKKFFIRALGDLQFGLNIDNFLSRSSLETFAQENLLLRWFLHSFLSCQRVVFVCRENFNFLTTDGRCKHVHFSHAISECVQLFTVCLHRFAHCTWIHSLHAWLKIALHSKRVVPSLAPCLTLWHTGHAARPLHLFLLFQVLYHREGWSHRQHSAQIHGNQTRVTVVQNNYVAQVMSPTGSSTTRSLMNWRTWFAMKTIRLLKLRIMSKRCLTTSHSCLQPRLGRKHYYSTRSRFSTTNTFVLC